MPNTEPKQRIEVVAAAIRRHEDGAVLLAKRGEHQHQGGKWEFPGGKVEAGEGLLRALSRELNEEIGVRCNGVQPLMTVNYDYPDKKVRLHFFDVWDWVGDPNGNEGQGLQWVDVKNLPQINFPAANQTLAKAMALGEQMLVFPDELPAHWEVRLHLALQRGVTLVVAASVTDKQVLHQISVICQQHHAKLLVGSMELVAASPAQGLHLTADRAQTLTQRPDVELLSIDCFSAADIERAGKLQADIAVISPVHATTTHPDAEPLGWEAIEALTQNSALIYFARGGVGPADLPPARTHGVWGVAGIEGFWPPEQLMH